MTSATSTFKRNQRVVYLGESGWLGRSPNKGQWVVYCDNGDIVFAHEKEIAHVSKNIPAEQRIEVN